MSISNVVLEPRIRTRDSIFYLVADGLPGVQKSEIFQLCDEVDILSHQLADLCGQGLGNSPQAQEVARKLSQKLHELKEKINQAVVNRVVEDFIDIVTPLKQFTEAALAPEGTPNRDQSFSDKAANLQHFSNRSVKTAKMVAAGRWFWIFLNSLKNNISIAEYII
ncbi:unnamed protein product [Diabrotica balteata]|uniref:Vinculin n=1 Tax=Diabrotica balteata TaxID=107213 RepID=A0A9N9SWA6_DIABA|nr:unnamed protein product [Diabrotica balteata]